MWVRTQTDEEEKDMEEEIMKYKEEENEDIVKQEQIRKRVKGKE
jgi:hypothetical protein